MKRFLFLLSGIISVFLMTLACSSSVYADSTQIVPTQWYVYGQNSYGSANAWSSAFSPGSNSGIMFYNPYQLQFKIPYNSSGPYVSVYGTVPLVVNNGSTTRALFAKSRPLTYGNCKLGSEIITVDNLEQSYTLNPSGNNYASYAYVNFSLEGHVTGSYSGDIVCTLTGVSGAYFWQNADNEQSLLSVVNPLFVVESFNNESDRNQQTQLDQLKQLTDINTNLGIVNGAINNQTQIQHQDSQNTQNAIKDLQRSQEDQANKENGEVSDASKDSDTSKDSSVSQGQQATASLLSVFTGFFDAIDSASPSTCQVNLQLPDFTGFGSWNLDFCQIGFDYPPIFSTIFGIAVCVPIAWFFLNRIFDYIMEVVR